MHQNTSSRSEVRYLNCGRKSTRTSVKFLFKNAGQIRLSKEDGIFNELYQKGSGGSPKSRNSWSKMMLADSLPQFVQFGRYEESGKEQLG